MKKERICGIYKFTSPSGRVYIGSSVNIKKRCSFARYKQQPLLFRSFKKYGFKNHIHEIIELCPVEHLMYYEIYYIWLYDTCNTPNGLNMTRGGEGGNGSKRSEETKQKMSAAQKGRKLSEERRLLCGLANLGKKHTPETIQKMIDARNTPEALQKNRERNSGERHPKSFLGKTHTPKTRERIAEKLNKIILNTQTGIFYFGVKAAAQSHQINHRTLGGKMCGIFKNNTPFIYV